MRSSIKIKTGVLEWAVNERSILSQAQQEMVIAVAQNLFGWLMGEAPAVISTQDIFYKMIEYAREKMGEEIDPTLLFSLGVLYEQAVYTILTGGRNGIVSTTN